MMSPESANEIVTCPNSSCTQKLRVPTDKGNLTVTCPKCRSSFTYSPGAVSVSQETKSRIEKKCIQCNADLSGQLLDPQLPGEYADLCDTCRMKKWKTECSVQERRFEDGQTATVIQSIPVGRATVENQDISDAKWIAAHVAEELRRTSTYQPWNLSISGYDADPRALCEIPEVRLWCKRCLAEIPYFLALLSQDTTDWFSLCVVGVNVIREGDGIPKVDMRIPEEDLAALAVRSIPAWNFFADCGVPNSLAGVLAHEAQCRLPWFRDVPCPLFWRSDHATAFIERIRSHLAKIMSASPVHRQFLAERVSDRVLTRLAALAADKMTLTASKGDEHSILYTHSHVYFVICTVAMGIHECARWYEQNFGGYMKLLEQCWNSPKYRISRSEVLCHITFGLKEGETWVNMSLLPIRSSRFSFEPIIATDLLTPEEQRMIEGHINIREMG